MDENGFGYREDNGVTFLGMIEIIIVFLAFLAVLYWLFS